MILTADEVSAAIVEGAERPRQCLNHRQQQTEAKPKFVDVRVHFLCKPGMGVNLWGESPLYMNHVPSFYDGSESTSRRQGPSLAMTSQEGDIVRCRLKEAGVQSYEPTDRNSI